MPRVLTFRVEATSSAPVGEPVLGQEAVAKLKAHASHRLAATAEGLTAGP